MNTKQIKKGDRLKLRSGGEVTATRDARWPSQVTANRPVDVAFKYEFGHISQNAYREDGTCNPTGNPHPEDIIEIIERPFDWDTVKGGDTFVHDSMQHGDKYERFSGKIMRWVGRAPLANRDVYEIEGYAKSSELNWLPKRKHLTRRHDLDIKDE